MLQDAWERLRLLCSQNCEAQAYDFASVLERAAELGAKRLLICDPGARASSWRTAPSGLLLARHAGPSACCAGRSQQGCIAATCPRHSCSQRRSARAAHARPVPQARLLLSRLP